MKELTIEQKARAYDAAIKRAKKLMTEGYDVLMPELFPELKESEDERIRKELLEHCKNQAELYIQTGNKCPQIQSWIAWLEKQNSNVDNANKEYWRGYREGKQEILDKYAELEKQGELKSWSEEDESILQGIWDEILANKHDAKEYEWKTYDRFLNFLKSLKDRVSNFDDGYKVGFSAAKHNQWKPSDEQLEFLQKCIEAYNEVTFPTEVRVLSSLYNDLKKLREE